MTELQATLLFPFIPILAMVVLEVLFETDDDDDQGGGGGPGVRVSEPMLVPVANPS